MEIIKEVGSKLLDTLEQLMPKNPHHDLPAEVEKLKQENEALRRQQDAPAAAPAKSSPPVSPAESGIRRYAKSNTEIQDGDSTKQVPLSQFLRGQPNPVPRLLTMDPPQRSSNGLTR